MKVSVLICTRDRAKSLDATLGSFFRQRFAGGYEYELIVVDNGSRDETGDVVRRHAARHPARVTHLQEPRRGLSYARNRAVTASSGEVIVFTDDDVLVSPNWLDEIHREFAADPRIAALGGRVLLARETLQQVSFLPGEERREYVFPGDGCIGMGANMAMRRDLLAAIGLFDVRLGAGRFFAGADEVDLFYRALRAGYRLLYAPNVLVHHDHDRVTVEQASRLEYGYGKGCAAYLVKHALRGDTHAMRMVYWLMFTLRRRWRRGGEEAEEQLRRRRAQLRGIAIGLFCAPWAMWGGGGERLPQPRPPRFSDELVVRSKI
ncbi:MAG: glycosyltransferase [Blastocatellia bacterium]|nr:glycosyltransferase [Blastocatellia bacterium]